MSDDDLRDLDLSAWEVPPPRADLADAVIARLREPAGAAAVEPVARASRTWWLGGALAAIAVAAAIALVIGRGGTSGQGFGAVIADRAREVSIGDTRGELDRGAVVVWRREGDVLVVAQAGGAATWRTGDGQRLRIEAMEASIDATGASLRVEVPMNMSDGRLIGASALTAAAVALATVVVYEGYVRVSSSGQTVTVQPGATVELRHGEPPAPPPVVGAQDEQIRKLEQEIEQLRSVQRSVQPAASPADSLDRAAISDAMSRARSEIEPCNGIASGTVRVHVVVAGDGSVSDVHVTSAPTAAVGSCVADKIYAIRFAATKQGGSFSYPFVVSGPPAKCDEVSCVLNNYDGECCAKYKKATPPPAACDPDALKQQGLNYEAQGVHAAALGRFEQALKCKSEPRVIQYAFMAACNSKNVAKARLYYQQMAPDAQVRFAQMCFRVGITKDQLDGGS